MIPSIPDRTTSETLHASPAYIVERLMENLHYSPQWSAFYTETYTSDNGLHVRLICGITTAFMNDGQGDQYGFVLRIVDTDDVQTSVFITTSYANPTASPPERIPGIFQHDQIASALIAFATGRFTREDGVMGTLKRFLGGSKDKLKGS